MQKGRLRRAVHRPGRAVYQTNDRRSAFKRQINGLLRSAIVEEKSSASAKEAEA